MSVPVVTVVIPTYRRPHLVGRAVRSVLAQDGVDFEVIVVDDEPSTPCERAVREIDDPRVAYLAHPVNRGLSAARNTGIEAAAAPYVAFLDDDDEYLPGRLRLQLDALESAPPEVGVASCYEEVVSADGSRTTVRAFDLDGDVLATLLTDDIIHAQMLMVRRSCFDRIGLFDVSLPHHEDFDMSLRLAREFDYVTVKEPLLRMYRADAALSKHLANRVVALERIIEKTPEVRADAKVRARWLVKLARLRWSAGTPLSAMSALASALRASPVAALRVLGRRAKPRASA